MIIQTFDAAEWAERIARDNPQSRRRAEALKESTVPNRAEVLRLIRAELEAFQKGFVERLYRDIAEAIPAHVQRELRINGGRN